MGSSEKLNKFDESIVRIKGELKVIMKYKDSVLSKKDFYYTSQRIWKY